VKGLLLLEKSLKRKGWVFGSLPTSLFVRALEQSQAAEDIEESSKTQRATERREKRMGEK